MCDQKVRNAIWVNSFDECAVKQFKVEFDELNVSNIPMLPIIIDSFGGEVYSLLAMLDIISTATKPVATIALGKAMSCGSILLSYGTKGLRFAAPNSTIMVHDVASVSIGKIEELKADVSEGDRLNSRIYEILDTQCGKKSGYFQKIITSKKHVNWYLDGKEALKHGIVDHVGVPSIDSTFHMDIIQEFRNKSMLQRKQRAPRKSSKPKPAKTKTKKTTKKK